MVKTVQNKKGLTLIELLIVVAILGILASIVLAVLDPNYFFGKGRDARRKSDLDTVRSALEQYYLDNGREYPTAASYSLLGTPLEPYMDSFPVDPGVNTYVYSTSAVSGMIRKCYELSTTLEETGGTYTVCGGSLSCQHAAGNNYCP